MTITLKEKQAAWRFTKVVVFAALAATAISVLSGHVDLKGAVCGFLVAVIAGAEKYFDVAPGPK